MNLALNSSLSSLANNNIHEENSYAGSEQNVEVEDALNLAGLVAQQNFATGDRDRNESRSTTASGSGSPEDQPPPTATASATVVQQLGPALQQTTGIEPFTFQHSTELFPGFHHHQSPLLHYPMRTDLMSFGGFRGGSGNGSSRKFSSMKGGGFDKTELQMQVREAKPYKCTHCVKSFANSSYLSQHMRIHLGIKPFGPCQYCGKKFTQLSHLQQHIRTHTGEKPYKCKFHGCEKAFSQLSNLQSHSRCHQADKPYKCNSCYKCFTDEGALLEHIPKHKESKHLKVHICPFCGKSYTQSTYLAKHMTKHADRRERDRLRPDFPELDQLGVGSWNGRGGDGVGNGSICPVHGIPDACVDSPHLATFGSFNAVSNMSAAAAAGYPTGGQAMQAMVNDPSAFTRLAGLASTFSRSLQAGGPTRSPYFYENSLKTGADSRSLPSSGFNMITPLENIQRYSQQGAAAAAAVVSASPQQHFSQSMLGVVKRDAMY